MEKYNRYLERERNAREVGERLDKIQSEKDAVRRMERKCFFIYLRELHGTTSRD